MSSSKSSKGYAAINVAGLAVGLAACLLIALYVQHEWSYDRFHEKSDRIFHVLTVTQREDQPQQRYARTSERLAPALEAEFPQIERTVHLQRQDGIVRRGANAFQEEITFAGNDFFEMFSFPLAKGNAETALDAPGSTVLSQAAAQKYFGNQNPVGKHLEVRLRGTFYDVTVTGVAALLPAASSITFDVLLSLSREAAYADGVYHPPSWRTYSPFLYVQLSSKKAAADLEAQLPAFVDRHLPEGLRERTHFALQPLTSVHRTPGVQGGLTPASDPVYTFILIGVALLILGVACANFVTLALSRSASRAREVGMRKVLGAVRAHIARQFWGEALLMTSTALLVGLMTARLTLPVFEEMVDADLHFGAWATPSMLAVLTGMLLFVALLAGGYPAIYLSKFHPVEVLTGRFRSRGRSRLTRALVVGVLENFHFQSLHNKIHPLVLSTQSAGSTIYARLAPGRTAEGLRAAETAWQEVAPDVPFTFTFLDEAVEQQYRIEERWTHTITWAAVLAILIATIGLAALAALAAQKRRREVSIRKVLGASETHLVLLLSRDFLKLAVLGFVLACPLAYVGLQRWLEEFAYHIEISWPTFLTAGLAALGIALLTVSYQAVRAARANPTEALRDE